MIKRLLNFWTMLPLPARWSAVGLLASLWFIKWGWDGVQVIGSVPAPGLPKIVFVSGGREIKSMNLDGSDSKLIARAPISLFNAQKWAYFSGLALRPDRQQIAVVMNWQGQDRNSDVWSMDISGDNWRNLTNTRHWVEGRPAFSADGTHILFLRNSPYITHGSGTYYSMNTRGRSIKIRENLNDDREIQRFLNPRGPWIISQTGFDRQLLRNIFHSDGKQYELPYEMLPQSWRQPRKLTTNRIALSPDGTRFAFDDLARDIYILNTNGTELINLTHAPFRQMNLAPRFTPDSRQIVFISNRDGNDEIYIMNADGTDQRRLTNSPQDEISFDVH